MMLSPSSTSAILSSTTAKSRSDNDAAIEIVETTSATSLSLGPEPVPSSTPEEIKPTPTAPEKKDEEVTVDENPKISCCTRVGRNMAYAWKQCTWKNFKTHVLFFHDDTSTKEKIFKSSISLGEGFLLRAGLKTALTPYLGAYTILVEVISDIAAVGSAWLSQMGITKGLTKWRLFNSRFDGLVVMNKNNNEQTLQLITDTRETFIDIINAIPISETEKTGLRQRTQERMQTIIDKVKTGPDKSTSSTKSEPSKCAKCFEKICCCIRFRSCCGMSSSGDN